jgi:hypothetical protein
MTTLMMTFEHLTILTQEKEEEMEDDHFIEFKAGNEVASASGAQERRMSPNMSTELIKPIHILIFRSQDQFWIQRLFGFVLIKCFDICKLFL